MECRDLQALELVVVGNLVPVRLQRKVKYSVAASSKQNLPMEDIEDVETAIWWPLPAERTRQDPETRRMNGEIRLSRNLKPSSAMAHFSVNVSAAAPICPSCQLLTALY